MSCRILVATGSAVVVVEPDRGIARPTEGLAGDAPTCLAVDPLVPGRAWCGTHDAGVFRSDDGGASWARAGLEGERLTAIAASPAAVDLVWAGAEPSAVWRSRHAAGRWERAPGLESLPSSSEWSFPPRPETHHVRWIALHPTDPGRAWVAVEAGALVMTPDGGRSWRDRVPGGPYDTHELALHPAAPDTLRVAAGDGYYESEDGGVTWSSPGEGLDVGYLRSVAIDPGDPGTVVVSASSRPRTAYVAGHSDGRVYRREGQGRWARVVSGWPDPPATIAPLLAAGRVAGELWAADERGVHRSDDGGLSWRQVAGFDDTPHNLRGLVVLPDP
jgi:photosystem II stability/assembly factor-like uncharacterized protein